MTSQKSKIRSVVSSSFIRREELNNVPVYSDIPSCAPYDDPNTTEIKKDFDIRLLSNVERKVLLKVIELICLPMTTTKPVYLDEFCKDIDHPISTVKKTIQKLENKNLIKRECYKAGRGGWTVYSVDQKTRDKLETN